MRLLWQPVHSVWPVPTWSVTSADLNASSAVLSTSKVRAPANGGAISAAHASSARHTPHGASGGIARRARPSPGHDHHACASALARMLRHPGWRNMAPAGAAALRVEPPAKRRRAGDSLVSQLSTAKSNQHSVLASAYGWPLLCDICL